MDNMNEDQRDVNALHQRIFGETLDMSIYEGSMIVMRDGDTGPVTGYLLFVFADEVVDLHYIAIIPEWRQAGEATILMDIFFEHIKAFGIVEVTLEVRSDNEAAIRLYERFGFEVVGTREKYYSDGCDAWLMNKELDPEKQTSEQIKKILH